MFYSIFSIIFPLLTSTVLVVCNLKCEMQKKYRTASCHQSVHNVLFTQGEDFNKAMEHGTSCTLKHFNQNFTVGIKASIIYPSQFVYCLHVGTLNFSFIRISWNMHTKSNLQFLIKLGM